MVEFNEIRMSVGRFIQDTSFLYKKVMRLQKEKKIDKRTYDDLVINVKEIKNNLDRIRFNIDSELDKDKSNKKLLKLNSKFTFIEEKFKQFLSEMSKYEDFKKITDLGYYESVIEQ